MLNLTAIRRRLLGLLILLLPFSGGIKGWSFLGEMSPEASAHVLIPLIAVGLVSSGVYGRLFARRDVLIKALLLGFALVILLSFAANATEILTSSFKGRSALHKFLTSTLLFAACVYLALLVSVTFDARTERVIVDSYWAGSVVCIAFSILELASWRSGVVRDLVYMPIAQVLFAAHNPEGQTGRLRSVAAEPAFFSGYAVFAINWLWFGFLEYRRRIYAATAVMMIGLVLLSQSRTGYVLLFTWIAGMLAYYHSQGLTGRAYRGLPVLAGVALLIYVAAFLLYGDEIGRVAGASDNPSNAARAAATYVGMEIFRDAPLLGIGFGEYAFGFAERAPHWAMWTLDMQKWLAQDLVGYWPSAFSLPARLLAETGLVGFLSWYGIWLTIVGALFRRYGQRRVRPVPERRLLFFMGVSVLLWLMMGVSTDSLRNLNAWIVLGVSSSLLVGRRDRQ